MMKSEEHENLCKWKHVVFKFGWTGSIYVRSNGSVIVMMAELGISLSRLPCKKFLAMVSNPKAMFHYEPFVGWEEISPTA
jgi:hypothetical protein